MINLNTPKRNSIKAPVEPAPVKPTKPEKEKKYRLHKLSMKNRHISVGKSLASVLDGSFLTKENLLRQIPFIVFITFLGLFYIANSYNAEKTIIEINRTKKQLEELRYEYITTKAALMFQSKQSEIAYRLANSQVKESTVPPIKLVKKTDEK
jgi:hypothetical protein